MSNQRKDQLIEQYEEAALGLLMEDYADTEGALLLQEFEAAMQQDSIASIPDELDAKCLKLIDQAYGKSRRRKMLSVILSTASKVAVVALVLLGLASATILSVDAFRTPVLNFILSHTEQYASLNFKDADQQTLDRFKEIYNAVLGYIPSGYQLVNQPNTESNMLDMRFQNDSGQSLLISVGSSNRDLVVDTENADYIEMDFAGHPAFLIQGEDLHLVWNNESEQLIYDIYANGLSADEFWFIAYALAE